MSKKWLKGQQRLAACFLKKSPGISQAEAMRLALEKMNRPKPPAREKPIHKWKRFYCIECLRKFSKRHLPADFSCPHCQLPVRGNTARVVAQVVTRLLRHRGLKPKARKTDYDEYLASDLWKTIRQRILERDRHTCGMCAGRAQIVHHKSYDRQVLDGLRDSDLIALCKPCHKEIEFTVTSTGKMVKNSLRVANQKLAAAIHQR